MTVTSIQRPKRTLQRGINVRTTGQAPAAQGGDSLATLRRNVDQLRASAARTLGDHIHAMRRSGTDATHIARLEDLLALSTASARDGAAPSQDVTKPSPPASKPPATYARLLTQLGVERRPGGLAHRLTQNADDANALAAGKPIEGANPLVQACAAAARLGPRTPVLEGEPRTRVEELSRQISAAHRPERTPSSTILGESFSTANQVLLQLEMPLTNCMKYLAAGNGEQAAFAAAEFQRAHTKLQAELTERLAMLGRPELQSHLSRKDYAACTELAVHLRSILDALKSRTSGIGEAMELVEAVIQNPAEATRHCRLVLDQLAIVELDNPPAPTYIPVPPVLREPGK